MRHWFTTACLTAAGVLLLSGGSLPISSRSRDGTSAWQDRVALDPRMPHVTAAQRQVWLDSLVEQWPNGIIPIWALHQDASLAEIGSIGAKEASPANSAWLDCPPMLEEQLTHYRIAHYFNGKHRLTEIFNVGDFKITRYEVDSVLNWTPVPIPVDTGIAKLAADLDADGEVELVLQYFDELKIYSSPDWRLRRRFVFTGMPITMDPVAVNIDDDPYLEIYVTPNTVGEDGMPTIIKYEEPSDSFKIIFQMWAPNGAIGQPAVGDFDEDGRVEFISGNNLRGGYELFEWQESMLVHIGSVGDVLEGASIAAVACRPKPGGQLHALLGHSFNDSPGTRYELMEPIGDNAFSLAYVFEDLTYYGNHPCWAADTDCDGLDEMVMNFRPIYRVWEWDADSGSFVSGCEWDEDVYGTLSHWYTVDLDQNGQPEWGTSGDPFIFRSFPDPDCDSCDSSGHCTPPVLCYCKCFADPACDGQTNVLDVVHAVNVAFRGGIPEPDPFPQCPDIETTDVDCSGSTDVLDMVHLVNVAFRSGDPSVEYCQPCP